MASTSSGSKRWCSSKTIAEKHDIVKFVIPNPTWKQKEVCSKFGIKQSTLATCLSKKEKIMEEYQNTDSALKKKRNRLSNYEDVDAALLMWFNQKRDAGLCLDGETLRTKATEFATTLGHDTVAENGITLSWINRWKNRHGILSKCMSGEAMAVDNEVVSDWKEHRLREILRKYRAEDIYNVDESALFWKLLPDQTLAFKIEKVHGGKKSKERVTLLIGGSMAGEKLPLLIIGKFNNPRCFRHVRHLPVKYLANSKSWMTGTIFREWLQRWDNSLTRQVALLVDNCPAHPHVTNLKHIELHFLPANTTARTQPMDCGIIKNVKHFYRRKLALKRLRAHEENIDLSFNLLDAMVLLRESWDLVKPGTIINCFREAGFTHCEEGDPEPATGDNDDFGNIFTRLRDLFSIPENVDAEQFLSVDDGVQVAGEITDGDILQQVSLQKPLPAGCGDGSSSSDDDVEPDVSLKEALLAARTLHRFVLQSGDAMTDQVKMARELQSFVEESTAARVKQTLITQYFQCPR